MAVTSSGSSGPKKLLCTSRRTGRAVPGSSSSSRPRPPVRAPAARGTDFVSLQRTSRCDTSLRTAPEALLRLIRQRWSIENEWHWARDTQLGEDAHRYANRTGAPVFSFLRTVVMNLLRRGGYRSIRQGPRKLAYDIKGMLALGGVSVGLNAP